MHATENTHLPTSPKEHIRFCPGCGTSAHALDFQTLDTEPHWTWDVFCRNCKWSGDISPDSAEKTPE